MSRCAAYSMSEVSSAPCSIGHVPSADAVHASFTSWRLFFSTAMSSIQPRSKAHTIPPEILLYIFSEASGLSPSAGCSLCLLSSWVYDVACPILYRTIRFSPRNAQKFGTLCRTFSRSPSSPMLHVLNIFWHDSKTSQESSRWAGTEEGEMMRSNFVHAISACKNLENLLIDFFKVSFLLYDIRAAGVKAGAEAHDLMSLKKLRLPGLFNSGALSYLGSPPNWRSITHLQIASVLRCSRGAIQIPPAGGHHIHS